MDFARRREDFNLLMSNVDNSVVSVFEKQGDQIRNQKAGA
jgi:hypothetical protein